MLCAHHLRRRSKDAGSFLATAKRWVRDHARGSEQFGLLASSQAMRLKPHAIDIRVSVNPIHWFLGDRHDTRSSYYLEDAATEFQVQGLEVDWACVTWDADLRRQGSDWSFHSFRGNAWTRTRAADRQRYLLNAYRVLLTRARQGMAIFVPRGERTDLRAWLLRPEIRVPFGTRAAERIGRRARATQQPRPLAADRRLRRTDELHRARRVVFGRRPQDLVLRDRSDSGRSRPLPRARQPTQHPSGLPAQAPHSDGGA